MHLVKLIASETTEKCLHLNKGRQLRCYLCLEPIYKFKEKNKNHKIKDNQIKQVRKLYSVVTEFLIPVTFTFKKKGEKKKQTNFDNIVHPDKRYPGIIHINVNFLLQGFSITGLRVTVVQLTLLFLFSKQSKNPNFMRVLSFFLYDQSPIRVSCVAIGHTPGRYMLHQQVLHLYPFVEQ